MLLSKQKQTRLYLTADLEADEKRTLRAASKTSGGVFAVHRHRFPPIDEVVAALDHIASRTIELPRVFHSPTTAA
jgi:hypothetical protein